MNIHLRMMKAMYHGFYKSIKQHNCFNIDNIRTCFMSSKSAYKNFIRIMWHWKLEKWCWKFSLAIKGF